MGEVEGLWRFGSFRCHCLYKVKMDNCKSRSLKRDGFFVVNYVYTYVAGLSSFKLMNE